jgi:RHS repeat-associated protein
MDGESETQDYGMRIYNPELGRFLSLDPLALNYPWNSPYSFAENQPIWAIDLDGLEKCIQIGKGYQSNCQSAPEKYSFSTYKYSRSREIVNCYMVEKYSKSAFIQSWGEPNIRIKYFWVSNDEAPKYPTQFGGDKDNPVPGFYIAERQRKVVNKSSTSSQNYSGNTSDLDFFPQVLAFGKSLTALPNDAPLEDKTVVESKLILEINFFQEVSDGVSEALVNKMKEKIAESGSNIELVVNYNVKVATDNADRSLDNTGKGYNYASKGPLKIALTEENNVEMHLIKQEVVEGWKPE